MKIVRMANYVGPRSGGMRTALRELGTGYLAAGHEPVLIIPGPRRSDEESGQGRVITLRGPLVPFTGGYRALVQRRGVATMLADLKPDRLEVSDRTTLRWTGRWPRKNGVLVAGDGPLRRRLERSARGSRLPVTFAGFITEPASLAGLLASADLVIAPGPVETFGLAALEALACGTPVVVSAGSALPEVIGAAGIAVPGEDFAAGAATVLGWPAGQRRARARARAEEFGWPAAISAFLAVHEALEEEASTTERGMAARRAGGTQ
jgi:glycosyltransferase involved in cell wall biosynthesis